MPLVQAHVFMSKFSREKTKSLSPTLRLDHLCGLFSSQRNVPGNEFDLCGGEKMKK